MIEENIENENTENETQVAPFLVEDTDKSEEVCLNCSKHKVGTKVCGILKPYRDYMRQEGVDDVEASFTCGEYEIQ